ncbi:MAG: LysR family transcriptional regulator [Herminiimonas sp.]|nr:LysR family transcriptional regulator [Herminiimonas sp.]
MNQRNDLPTQEGAQRLFDRTYKCTQPRRRARTNLQQWRVFHAVVTCGGYLPAAQYLHLTQPAISYAIIKLEQQLGVTLLSLDGRKARLTRAGKILLEPSLHMLRVADELESTAAWLAVGGEPKVPTLHESGIMEV